MNFTKIVEELNLKDTYILEDKHGWLFSDHKDDYYQRRLLRECPEILTGFKLDFCDGYEGHKNGCIVIDTNDLNFFRIINNQKHELILIGGNKRSGKNFVADIIKEEFEKLGNVVDVYAFADPIKDILCQTFCVDVDELNELKNENTPILFNLKNREFTINMRDIIQKFGTEGMQKSFGIDVWKNKALEFIKYSKANKILITDFRFASEYINNAKTIQIINNDIKEKETHISETSLKDFRFDNIIDNTGKPSKSNLIKQLNEIKLFD